MIAGEMSQVPQSIGWMSPPLVVGLFAALVPAAAVALCWWAYRRDTYRRTALRDLDDLVPQLYDEETRKQDLAKLAILLKRTALAKRCTNMSIKALALYFSSVVVDVYNPSFADWLIE